jgi:hypothetical protein
MANRLVMEGSAHGNGFAHRSGAPHRVLAGP